MALQSSVGIKVGVSATLPTTHDDTAVTGFPGMTYINCGKLNSPPPMTGTKDVATFENLSTGEEEKLLDILRAGNGEMAFGYDEADTGQTALQTAADATTGRSLKGCAGIYAGQRHRLLPPRVDHVLPRHPAQLGTC